MELQELIESFTLLSSLSLLLSEGNVTGPNASGKTFQLVGSSATGSNFPPCSWQNDGIICPAFFVAKNVITVSLLVPAIALAAFVLYIAFARISLKEVTNLYSIHVITTTLMLQMVKFLKLFALYIKMYGFQNTVFESTVYVVSVFTNQLATNSYQLLSLVFLLSLYCLFKWPLLYNQYFSLRYWKLYFVGVDLFVVAFSTFITIESSLPTGLNVATFSETYLFFATYTATTLASITAVVTVVTYYFKKTDSGEANSHATLLISTVLYVTPMALANVPNLVIKLMLLMVGAFPQSETIAAVFTFSTGVLISVSPFQPILLSLSTLFALNIYRVQLYSIFKCCSRGKKCNRIASSDKAISHRAAAVRTVVEHV